MNAVSLIVGLLLGIVLVAFGAQNAQPVNLYFFAWETPPIPVVLVLGAAILLGILVTLLLSIPGRIRGGRERRDLLHQLEAQRRMAAPAAEQPPPERHDALS